MAEGICFPQIKTGSRNKGCEACPQKAYLMVGRRQQSRRKKPERSAEHSLRAVGHVRPSSHPTEEIKLLVWHYRTKKCRAGVLSQV